MKEFTDCDISEGLRQGIAEGCAHDALIFFEEFRPLTIQDIGLVAVMGAHCKPNSKTCGSCTKEETCHDGTCVPLSTPCAPGCFHGGVCKNDVCQCTDPLSFGDHCEYYAPCKNKPCQNNGVCIENGKDYFCSCEDGFSGENCESYNPCDLHNPPCENESECIKQSGTDYSCKCVEGSAFEGKHCEKKNPCLLQPCQNGSQCTNEGNNKYTCECTSPFTGVNCETFNPCSLNPCENCAKCINNLPTSPNPYQCKCEAGFSGPKCENMTPCDLNPCKNGGQCTQTSNNGDYSCTCAGNFIGPNCADVNSCSPNPCGSDICYRVSNTNHECASLACGETKPGYDAWCKAYTPYGENMCRVLTGGLCEYKTAPKPDEEPLQPKLTDLYSGCDSTTPGPPTESVEIKPYAGGNCDGPEGLIIIEDTEVKIMKSTGELVTCQGGLFNLVSAARGEDGEIYVLSDMGQKVDKISKDCSTVTPLLNQLDGLVRPSAVAYKSLGGGKYSLAVANTQGAYPGFIFTFDNPTATKPSKIDFLGTGPVGLYHLHYDETDGSLYGVSNKRQIGTFDPETFAWTSFPLIPAIVDMRNIGMCAGQMYIAADDNNAIYRCDDLADVSTCVDLCTKQVTNPWAIGIGTDCSIYTANRGPGAGDLFKLTSSNCYGQQKLTKIPVAGDGIKTIIPFPETEGQNCPGVQNVCKSVCGQGTPIPTCNNANQDFKCAYGKVENFDFIPCDNQSEDCYAQCCTTPTCAQKNVDCGGSKNSDYDTLTCDVAFQNCEEICCDLN
eukprot:Awhi_evm2s2482